MLSEKDKVDLKRKLANLNERDRAKFAQTPAKETNSALKFTSLGFEFAFYFGIFVYFGKKLDENLGSSPAFILLGVFIGMGLAIYRLIQATKEPTNDKSRNQD